MRRRDGGSEGCGPVNIVCACVVPTTQCERV